MATNMWRNPRLDRSDDSAARLSTLLSEVAYALFVITNILSICAVKLGVGGLPFRMWTLLGAGALLVLADGAQVMRAMRETSRLLLVITVAALIGLAVSVIARAPLLDVGRQLIEIHIQALVGIVISYTLMLRFGVPRVLAAFLIAYGITAFFAIGQAMQLDAAWALRERVASITADSIFNLPFYDPRERAMGMSYTPVLFATQTCVALAAWTYIRMSQGSFRSPKLDWTIIGATLALIVLCALTGNRSPTLGLGVFLMVFLVVRWPALVGIVLPGALLVAVVGMTYADRLGDTGLRVARLDNSSENRGTLRAYGLYLVERRPIGYGLTFDSTRKWPVFYQQSIYMPNPSSIRNWVLHNYYLNSPNQVRPADPVPAAVDRARGVGSTGCCGWRSCPTWSTSSITTTDRCRATSWSSTPLPPR